MNGPLRVVGRDDFEDPPPEYYERLAAEAPEATADAPAPCTALAPRVAASPMRAPHDPDAERAVLSAALTDPPDLDRILAVVAPEDMYGDAHRRILAAVAAVHAAGTPVDIATVAAHLRARDELGAVGDAARSGLAYLANVLDATPAVAHVEAHARIVRDLADRRRLADRLRLAAAAADDARTPIASVVGEVRGAVDAAHPVVATSWPRVDLAAPVPPIDYLVRSLDLCAGAPAMLAGLGYSGKTVSLQQAAVDLALDREVWGEFAARRGARVLHLDAEQGQVTTVRYQRIAAAAGADLSALSERLAVVTFPPLALDSPNAEPALLRECDRFDLVILDSYRALVHATEENSSEARVPLDMLGRVSAKTGAVIVVVHHARKPTKDAPGGTKATIRGSGALFDGCASVLILAADKGEPTFVEHVKARASGKPVRDFYLAIEDVPIGSDPRGGLRVVHKSVEQVTGRDPVKVHEGLMATVRRFLADHPDTPGKGAIVARLRGDRTKLFAAFSELEARGEIVNVGTVKQPKLRLRPEVKP